MLFIAIHQAEYDVKLTLQACSWIILHLELSVGSLSQSLVAGECFDQTFQDYEENSPDTNC